MSLTKELQFESRRNNFDFSVPRKQKFIFDGICCPPMVADMKGSHTGGVIDQCTVTVSKCKVRLTRESRVNN